MVRFDNVHVKLTIIRIIWTAVISWRRCCGWLLCRCWGIANSFGWTVSMIYIRQDYGVIAVGFGIGIWNVNTVFSKRTNANRWCAIYSYHVEIPRFQQLTHQLTVILLPLRVPKINHQLHLLITTTHEFNLYHNILYDWE